MKQQRIVSAANRYGSVIVPSARHYDPSMHKLIEYIGRNFLVEMARIGGEEQGFIDQHGAFLSRTEAWKVAEAAGQIIYRCGGDDSNGGTLYSENLY